MNVEFTVKFIHFAGIEKDQANEDVNRTLLGKPETKLVAPRLMELRVSTSKMPKPNETINQTIIQPITSRIFRLQYSLALFIIFPP